VSEHNPTDSTPPPAHHHVELTDQLLAGSFPFDDPEPLYDELRRTAPVAWNETAGFWALSTHRDVHAVATDPVTFCSGRGILVSEIGTTYDSPPTMMHTDPPDHTRYRSIVQPAFSRRRMALLAESVAARVDALMVPLLDGASAEIVSELAVPLPLQVISDLLGLDHIELSTMHLWSDASIPDSTGLTDERRMELLGEMWATLSAVCVERRANPRDDLISDLVSAGAGGKLDETESLTDAELAMFLIQLLVAGNETTRNVISGGLIALAEHPEQYRRLASDASLIAPAVEELLRWTTPVVSFVRTATCDTELSGVAIGADDPVLLLYGAANRDPAEFGPTAATLDVGRSPNHHLAFGFGAHFCLGAALARLEVAAVLEALVARVSAIHLENEPTRSPSTIIAGVLRAPVTLVLS